MKIPSICLILVSTIFVVSCTRAEKTGTGRPLLFQNYRLMAEKGKTNVEATVFFRDRLYEAESDIVPVSVTLNGVPLERAQLPSYVAPTFSHLLKDGHEMIAPTEVGAGETIAGFAGSFQSFSRTNTFVVTGLGNDERRISLDFAPVEFNDSDRAVLSKSRDNELNFVGGSPEKPIGFGFVGEPGRFDERLVEIDFVAGKIRIPARSLAKLKTGPNKIFVVSSDNGFINEPYSGEGRDELVRYISSYIFVYKAEADVLITD